MDNIPDIEWCARKSKDVCSVRHVPPDDRNRDGWKGIEPCEAFLVSDLKEADWPTTADGPEPSDGATDVEIVILCPTGEMHGDDERVGIF